MKPASIPLNSLARLAFEGRVFRSFGRFLAVQNGSLLAVPLGLVTGDFSAVRDSSPVPWTELLAAIETAVDPAARVISPEAMVKDFPLISSLFTPYGWVQDSISVSEGSAPVSRLNSPDGVVFCWVRQD